MFQLTAPSPPRPRKTPSAPSPPVAAPHFRAPEPDDVDPSYLTSLDTQETNREITPKRPDLRATYASDDPEVWRHSAWLAQRRRVLETFPLCDTVSESRITRYRECGTRAWVFHHTEGPRFKIHSAACKDRWCQSCQSSRAHIIRSNLAQRLQNRDVRFLTLTLRANGSTLSDRVDQIYAASAALRRLPFWKQHVLGGAQFIELKWIGASGNWHVHAHLLVEGRFIPHHALRACWKAVTTDSCIVDIRKPKNSTIAQRYVTKYVTKPVPDDIYADSDLLSTAIDALYRRRLCVAFGSWRGWRLLDTPSAGTCTPVMPLRQLISRARAGDRFAADIIDYLDTHRPATWQLESAYNPARRPPPDERSTGPPVLPSRS